MNAFGTAVVAVVLILLIVMMYRWKAVAEVQIAEKKAEERPVKDPSDWSLTEGSTPWITDHFCPVCKATIRHNEWMANICNNCGSHGNMRSQRSRRKIWDGKAWVHQFKYNDGTTQFLSEEKCPPLYSRIM